MNVDSSNKVTTQFSNEEEEEEKTVAKVSKFHGWHSNGNNDNSSRIFRVSRATGGKDRHSKVLTSKGLRDRRVRLSVSTAIDFYDLQDRLGYDQPSKAVEWLIKASEEAISELPVLNTPFSAESTPFLLNKKQQQLDADMDRNLNPNSSLSLSRPEEIRVNRVKARERAREIRVAKEREKEKEKENEMRIGVLQPPNQTLVSQQNASFTELLTSGILFSTTQSMIMSPFSATTSGDNHNHNHHHHHHHSSSSELHQQQHFTTNDMQHYDLNFRMSSSSSDCFNNRGTLQSNLSLPSLFPPHQYTRFSSQDGPSNNNNNNNDNNNNNNNNIIPFFFGAMPAAAPSSVSSETNNNSGHHHHHHRLQQDHYSQFDAGFDGRLQLFHGDGTPHSDQKGKRKN